MGGITTSLTSETSIPGLYAVGENASTGVHGANRLASNSLLECLVYGAQLQHIPLPSWTELPEISPSMPIQEISLKPVDNSTDPCESLREAMAQLVWQTAGISRQAVGLQQAITTLHQYQQAFDNLPLTQVLTQLCPGQCYQLPNLLSPKDLRSWGELRNLLTVAHLLLKSALFRTESRGGHYREDYPATDPAWQVHTLIQESQCWQSEPLSGSSTKADPTASS
jgi:L-aspartate oxidase